mmetsp:Transcript_20049/g.28527  ORF Transcript_20049/g.28527 Transcript_20049/m.28527 type:complete len:105 (-) Transcript_20049:115-429(-)
MDNGKDVPFFRSGSADYQVYLVADIDVPNNSNMKVWLREDTTSLSVQITDDTVGWIDGNATAFPFGQYNSDPLPEANWDVKLKDDIPNPKMEVPPIPSLDINTC